MRILSRLSGGLGNQLFQYAAAHALALDTGAKLELDIRGLRGRAGHNIYGLSQYAITGRLAPPWRLPHIRKRDRAGVSWPKLLRRYEHIYHSQRYYLPIEPCSTRNILLRGYFQSEKYFIQHADSIRREFQRSSAIRDDALRWQDQIRSAAASVSIHYRRGDYLSLGANGPRGFVNCGAGYYAAAVDYLAQQFGDLHLFVFSDDPNWAREHARFLHPTHVVDCATRYGPQDELGLMASCHHNITANSTFSWWGGWLNTAANKVVISPDKWNRGNRGERIDIVPQSWVRIPADDTPPQRPK